MSDTCPKCGTNYNGRPALNRHDYWCGSTTWVDGDFYQSPECVRRERDQLLERIKRLEEKLADRERERDHANDTADAVLAENKALTEQVKRLEEAAGLALGYAAKGDFETADEVLAKAKGQP